jgi:hypothetical protein
MRGSQAVVGHPEFEVLWLVVILHAVPMVNGFIRKKMTSHNLLHDESVLVGFPPPPLHGLCPNAGRRKSANASEISADVVPSAALRPRLPRRRKR